MKASLSLATILLVAGIPAANAQNEFAIANHTGACPNCSIQEQKILKLEAEIAALQGQTTPLTEPVPITPEAAAIVESSDLTYTVQPGDGLMKIARKTNCKASAIAAANNMAMDDIIRPGQVLKLPATATELPKAAAVNESPKPTATTRPKTYKVKEGETYYRISRNLKIPLDELMAANPKVPANRLYTGRVLNLPMKDAVPAPAPVVETPITEEPPAIESTETVSNTAPATEEIPAVAEDAPALEQKIIAVSVTEEISYGDFAAKHGTTTERLNSLNDLNLTSATILAKGSELYVPSTVQTASN